jgi:hypothetical protein
MIEQIIDQVIQDPTENNKELFLTELNKLEHSLLLEAENYNNKSTEYFKTRTKAFSIRPQYAKMILNKWVAKFKTTQGCPLKYEDTLNIPFRQIKKL